MNDAPKYTTLRDYLRVLREQRLIIIAIIVVFVGAALAVTAREHKQYRARASLNFQSENVDSGTIGAGGAPTESADQRAATKARQINKLSIATEAAKLAETSIRPQAILSNVDIVAEARTNFVVVSFKSRHPKLAADLANAYATAALRSTNDEAREHYQKVADDLKANLKKLPVKPVNALARRTLADRIAKIENLAQIATPAELAVRAEAPSNAISPKPVRNVVLGFLLGLTFALLTAFVRDALDRRFKSVREIREELKLPLVGHIRDDLLGRSVVSVNGRSGLEGGDLEAFRIMRTNVDFLDVDRDVSPIVVTSALPEEGKSTVAAALAAAYATAGKLTLLVECDLRRPVLATRLGLESTPGISDYLAGQATPEQILQPVRLDPTDQPGRRRRKEKDGKKTETAAEASSLMCIVAGTTSPQPAELLGSERFKAFLEQVSSVYDAVILDATPLLSVVDTLELVPNVSGVLVCVRASRTTRDQARAAKAALEHFPARPAGVVVTGVRPGDEADYGYYAYAYAYRAPTA
jgi:Mrp family chromosome partitioning ATPase/capsular polysaccharide biosynthesis protein